MKKRKYILGFIMALILSQLFISCATIEFDRTLLQASGETLSPKLPKLEILSADSLVVGSSNQIESSSMFYTIFRREVEKNICESVGLEKGFIEMELIYFDISQNHNMMYNLATLELEIRIFDKSNNKIWSNVYSGDFKLADFGLGWTYNYIDSSANTAVAMLAHQLLENLKIDLIKDYDLIVSNLNN